MQPQQELSTANQVVTEVVNPAVLEKVVERPQVKCENIACELYGRPQFRTQGGNCRRCKRPLPADKDEVVIAAPILLKLASTQPETESPTLPTQEIKAEGLNRAEFEKNLAIGERVRRTLTPKELQITYLITFGWKNRDIAQKVGTSEQVVKNYLRSIYDKVGVSSRLELALFVVYHSTLIQQAKKLQESDSAQAGAGFIRLGDDSIGKVITAKNTPATVAAAAAEVPAATAEAESTTVAEAPKPELSRKARKILEAVCELTGYTLKELRGTSRRPDISEARSLAMHLLKEVGNLSMDEIATALNRKVVTVYVALARVTKKFNADKEFASVVRDLRKVVS